MECSSVANDGMLGVSGFCRQGEGKSFTGECLGVEVKGGQWVFDIKIVGWVGCDGLGQVSEWAWGFVCLCFVFGLNGVVYNTRIRLV